MKTTVPVATFNDPEPARQLQQRLQQAGLAATIHDESNLERYWFMTPALAAIHIEVPTSEYLAARCLLADWDRVDGGLKHAVCCPECRSSRVEFPQLTRKFALPSLMRVFMALRLVRQEFYCLDCHCTWPTEVPVPRQLNLLGFPVETRWTRWREERRRRKLARALHASQT